LWRAQQVVPSWRARCDARDRTALPQIGRWLASALIGFAGLACGDDQRPPGPSSVAGASAGVSGAGSTANAGAGGAAGSPSSAAGSAGAAGAAGSSPDAPLCPASPECQRLCSGLADDPAACGLGDRGQCGCLCEERFDGPCPGELAALSDCIRDEPSVDCRERGRIFPGCEDESFALEACDFAARDQLCAGAYPACTPFCRGLRLAFCPSGPESAAACLCGCEATVVTRCATEFEAFMGCTEQTPSFACDGEGRVVAASCEPAWQALAACMAVPAPGSADAGG
jgi:hypothetical protein